MRLSKTTWLLATSGMTLGVFGVAAAQTGTAGPAQQDRPEVAAVQAPREVDLPPAQQLALARQFVGRMEQGSLGIRAQLRQARAARDVVKSLCLNDKLNQINVAKRSARDRLATLHAAADANDKDRSKHEFMLLQELRDRADQIVKEAQQCIGEEAGFIGDTEVSLEVSKEIPDNNPDQLGFDPEIITDPPVETSPRM